MTNYKVPDELVEQLIKGDVLLFVGDEMAIETKGERGYASQQDVMDDLIARTNYPPEEPRKLALVAGYFEALYGRHTLNRYMIDTYSDPSIAPNKAHQLAVKLPCPLIVTTSINRMLERALETPPAIPYHPFIGDADIPYQDSGKKIIAKLCGSVDQPDSLVITEDDYANLLHRIPALHVVILSHFATKTLLFIGYDLQGEFFYHFYNSIVLRSVDRHRRRAYAVLESPSPVAAAIWARRDLAIIAQNPTEFLESLTLAISSYKKPLKGRIRKQSLPDAPYKFLDYFEKKDSAIFFGRDAEAAHLVRQIAAHKLTVLVGQSGVGKTSLLNAGVIPKLEEEGYQTVYIRALINPTEMIKKSIWGMIEGQSLLLPPQAESMKLKPFLEATLPNSSRVVFIIDQFEEFFMRLGDASRKDFSISLSDCINSEMHDLRFVLALREDYLYRLLEMEPPIKGIFSNRFWLRNLDESRARDAIMEPARAFGLSFDDALLETLLDDLETGGVDPSQLQIVCFRLYQTLGEQNVFTIDLYRQLGGTKTILSNYLDEVIESLKTDEEKEAARVILKCMVTSERTKAALSAMEIARDAIVHKIGMAENQVTNILKTLQNHRIIRRLPEEDDIFELAHEVMVEKVWQWINAEDITYKYVREMLRQALADWRQLKILPSAEKWQLINEHKENLTLDLEEANLMMNSAIQIGEEMGYWIKIAEKSGVDIWEELKSLLLNASPSSRHNALRWVSLSNGTENVITMAKIAIGSEYPALRRQAWRILSNLDDSEAYKTLSSYSPSNEAILIPAGFFVMGTDDGRYDDEQPAHRVYLDAYYVHRHPVTNIEYLEFVKDTKRKTPDHWEDGNIPIGKEDHPVVRVSWYDALAYCQWLAEMNGIGFRLPTEAEWEKAAGWDQDKEEKRRWAWGNEYDHQKGNTRIGGPGTTTPIGQYSPAGGDSPYGLSDMSGNTFDWVSDWWSKTYYAISPEQNPKGPDSGEYKVCRGGSWAGSSEGASVVSRYYTMRPDVRSDYIGFRLAFDFNDEKH